jgi:pimeloyl-ACP methyl ester carboxylesterase
MRQPGLAWATLGVALATWTATARGQGDFGRLFEDAARKVARDAVVGEGGLAQQLGARAGVEGGEARTEPYTVRTQDGWTLVAHRYRPAGGRPKPGTMPVILCHGLSYNASFWDLDPNVSLARYLAEQGYDVWVADLRGGGFSQKWVWKLDQAPEMILGGAVRRLSRGKLAPTGYATADPKFANWTLDHHVVYDVPAFVSLVRRETGAPEVAWVGHSMGGIVAICYLERVGNPGIGRLVTIGSQVTMPHGQLPVQFLRELVATRTEMLAGQLNGQALMAATRTSVHNMFFNQENVAPTISEALGTWATDVPSIGVLQQYMTLGSTGQLLDHAKQYNYAAQLDRITVPTLICCGAEDQFAPPEVQQYLYEHIGSTDKTFLVFGRSMGFAADAGHDDALVGLNSKAQVYPVLVRWLQGDRFRAR